MRLKNKIAIITGGNSGMGLATAKRFEKEGAKVAIIGRNKEAIDAISNDSGNSIKGYIADVSNTDAIQNVLKDISTELGKVDVLFLNAGVAKPRPFTETGKELYNLQWDVNFGGTYFTIQSALPLLNDGASIVLNTSTASVKGHPGMSVYSATKAAMRSLVRTLAIELAPRNIRINAMSPGAIETPIWGKLEIPEEASAGFKEGVKTNVPLGRVGTSNEVANAVLFLASEEASYITGVDLPVDGGFAQV